MKYIVLFFLLCISKSGQSQDIFNLSKTKFISLPKIGNPFNSLSTIEPDIMIVTSLNGADTLKYLRLSVYSNTFGTKSALLTCEDVFKFKDAFQFIKNDLETEKKATYMYLLNSNSTLKFYKDNIEIIVELTPDNNYNVVNSFDYKDINKFLNPFIQMENLCSK